MTDPTLVTAWATAAIATGCAGPSYVLSRSATFSAARA